MRFFKSTFLFFFILFMTLNRLEATLKDENFQVSPLSSAATKQEDFIQNLNKKDYSNTDFLVNSFDYMVEYKRKDESCLYVNLFISKNKKGENDLSLDSPHKKTRLSSSIMADELGGIDFLMCCMYEYTKSQEIDLNQMMENKKFIERGEIIDKEKIGYCQKILGFGKDNIPCNEEKEIFEEELVNNMAKLYQQSMQIMLDEIIASLDNFDQHGKILNLLKEKEIDFECKFPCFSRVLNFKMYTSSYSIVKNSSNNKDKEEISEINNNNASNKKRKINNKKEENNFNIDANIDDEKHEKDLKKDNNLYDKKRKIKLENIERNLSEIAETVHSTVSDNLDFQFQSIRKVDIQL